MVEVNELSILISLGANTTTTDWNEIIEQLYAQMMGWS